MLTRSKKKNLRPETKTKIVPGPVHLSVAAMVATDLKRRIKMMAGHVTIVPSHSSSRVDANSVGIENNTVDKQSLPNSLENQNTALFPPVAASIPPSNPIQSSDPIPSIFEDPKNQNQNKILFPLAVVSIPAPNPLPCDIIRDQSYWLSWTGLCCDSHLISVLNFIHNNGNSWLMMASVKSLLNPDKVDALMGCSITAGGRVITSTGQMRRIRGQLTRLKYNGINMVIHSSAYSDIYEVLGFKAQTASLPIKLWAFCSNKLVQVVVTR